MNSQFSDEFHSFAITKLRTDCTYKSFLSKSLSLQLAILSTAYFPHIIALNVTIFLIFFKNNHRQWSPMEGLNFLLIHWVRNTWKWNGIRMGNISTCSHWFCIACFWPLLQSFHHLWWLWNKTTIPIITTLSTTTASRDLIWLKKAKVSQLRLL